MRQKGNPDLYFKITTSNTMSAWTPTAAVAMAAPDVSKFHIFSLRGPTLEIQSGGVTSTGTTSTSNIDAVGGSVRICNYGNSRFGTAEIAEVLAIKGTLSDTDLGKLTAYLKAKFNL